VSAFLYRLGHSCARHPFRVLGIWLVAAVAVVALQGAAGGKYDNSIRVPGVESQRAADVLSGTFPSQGGKTARVVFHTNDGRLDDAGLKTSIEQARQQLASGHDVTNVTDPFAPQSAAVSADGRTAYVDGTARQLPAIRRARPEPRGQSS
jgi:RND superfamily putative drug exporter